VPLRTSRTVYVIPVVMAVHKNLHMYVRCTCTIALVRLVPVVHFLHTLFPIGSTIKTK